MSVNVADLQRKIAELEKKLEKSKTEKATLEGKLESLLDQLKKQFKVATIQAGAEKLTALDAEIATLGKEQEQIPAEIEKILTIP